jgi:subtilase family serine protease
MMKATALLLISELAIGLGVASAQPRPAPQQLADLEVYAVALADNGAVIYQVANRGNGSTERPFVVDVYVNGVRKDSITHNPLPALTMQAAQSNLARVLECKAGTVRLVLDAQNSVREANKTNNERTTQLVPACARSAR